MTNQLNINFYTIHTWKAFYRQLRAKAGLPDFFGDNLDALWDWLTGDAELPIYFYFDNVSAFQQQKFKKLFAVFAEAETETGGQVKLTIAERTDDNDVG